MSTPNAGNRIEPDAHAPAPPLWSCRRIPWGRRDAVALAVWTLLIAAFFHEVVLLRRAFFYFDVTEINYPYRHFFASELRDGRFSRWIPGLYCGHPLYSESQAGYFHPFKYLLYPWLATWRAFGLDTVLSVWLTGVGAYGWLRRHVGALGAWTGGAVFALSGYTWAHFVHTSMINALASVPFALWTLECAWERRSLRAMVLGGLALACQVFAGHLQDVILTGSALAVYGVYRTLGERTWGGRAWSLGAVLGMGMVCVLVSAIQWIPSKELIDRSPRAGGLTWDELTYGSWSPELLPTMLVRSAYGTRARDTDWMDGFYPYLEMNTYLGIIALGLAILGLAGYRDRWVGFWPILAGLGLLLMLGRFCVVMDVFPAIPFVNKGRVPVRYHLWLAIAVAALAAVGADRLSRPECGRVRMRWAVATIGVVTAIAICIMLYVYEPAWTERARWPLKYHADRYAWLERELWFEGLRFVLLALVGWFFASWAARRPDARRRAAATAFLAALAAGDLLWTHREDAPTIDPAYWTRPPATAGWLLEQPGLIRVYGEGVRASGEPGYASQRVDFMAIRESLAWSLPPVWGLRSTGGETPIIPQRRLWFTDRLVPASYDLEGLSHVVTSSPTAEQRLGPGVRVGPVTIHANSGARPRARLLGRPVYARDGLDAGRLIAGLDSEILERIVVEDDSRPLDSSAEARGSARIVLDMPERVVVDLNAESPAYLFLADSFDPGWSARLDGRVVPIRPAYAAFRAVYVPTGKHRVEFNYEPAGWRSGLVGSFAGLLFCIALWFFPRRPPTLDAAHGISDWPARWPIVWVAILLLIVAASVIEPGRPLSVQKRWDRALHRFTWGAGIEAMRQ